MQIPQPAAQAPPAPHLDTLEILDNDLRRPLDEGRAVRPEPLAVNARAHWLVIQCVDKPGSLAEIAHAIAQHEQNIKVKHQATSRQPISDDHCAAQALHGLKMCVLLQCA